MSTDPSEIQHEIEQTRDELGRTVEELTDRLDVRKQAGKRVQGAKEEAQKRLSYAQQNAREQPQLPIALAVALAALAGFALWRRARR